MTMKTLSVGRWHDGWARLQNLRPWQCKLSQCYSSNKAVESSDGLPLGLFHPSSAFRVEGCCSQTQLSECKGGVTPWTNGQVMSRQRQKTNSYHQPNTQDAWIWNLILDWLIACKKVRRPWDRQRLVLTPRFHDPPFHSPSAFYSFLKRRHAPGRGSIASD